MKPLASLDDMPVLGKLNPSAAAAKLREMGDTAMADAMEQAMEGHPQAKAFVAGAPRWWGLFEDKAWQHTAHAFGYLAPAQPGGAALPIRHAGDIAPDVTLKNARVKITLDRLRVASYPGGGTHHVLFDFYAENQLPGQVEQLHFNSSYRAREGEQVAVIGYPIFVGLHVGTEGLSFRCYTVNVKNDEDEALLGFLESDVFRAGLKLASAAQPAIAPLSSMAVGLTRALAARSRNVA